MKMIDFKKDIVPHEGFISKLVTYGVWGAVHHETRFRLRAIMRLVATPVIRRIRNENGGSLGFG